MHSPVPLTRDLVLIGGGHSHALVLRKWGMHPLPGARLTLINPGPTAPYTGMLPGHIAGHYPREALEIDLVRLARFAGARLVLGAATHIDRAHKQVIVPGRPAIRYDIASLDVGITSDIPDLPGFSAHGVAAKPLARFAARWSAFCENIVPDTDVPMAVIGAGVAGVELALAMHHRVQSLNARPQITLIDASDALTDLAGGTRAVLFEALRRAEIRVRERCAVDEVTPDAIVTANGKTIPSTFTLGAAGARPHDWLRELGLRHDAGYLSVDPFLRSVDDPSIYACGDCAHILHAPRPKAGVYAVRAAPILHANLLADLLGRQRRRFHPQKDYLKLISMGGKRAVADKLGITAQGAWLWRQKDRIDQAFMDKFVHLPPMSAPPLPARRAKGGEGSRPNPLCGGCGAKVGGADLGKALSDLPTPARTDVLSEPGDDAAILRHGTCWQVMTTDHLRAFTEDPVTLTRIAAIHALGDIWAMGASPQAATATVILPRMAPQLQASMLAEIMQTAAEVFRAEGAEVVGGHSTLGAEMTVGFTITGLSDAQPLTLEGAEAGDALILTRPIGTGTLLAAEMRGLIQGPDLAELLNSLSQPQGHAARTLISAGARAMTDVTGFGLAGHLMNLCEGSGCGADLMLDRVPVYQGALSLAERGVRSTLWQANRDAVAGAMSFAACPLSDLLFDPQTAGGLLAAIPEHAVDTSLAALTEAGVRAVKIGHMVQGTPFVRVV